MSVPNSALQDFFYDVAAADAEQIEYSAVLLLVRSFSYVTSVETSVLKRQRFWVRLAQARTQLAPSKAAFEKHVTFPTRTGVDANNGSSNRLQPRPRFLPRLMKARIPVASPQRHLARAPLCRRNRLQPRRRRGEFPPQTM